MANGTVKWFNDSKGLVLLQAKTVVMYCSSYFHRGDGFKSLAEGDSVNLILAGPKGLRQSM